MNPKPIGLIHLPLRQAADTPIRSVLAQTVQRSVDVFREFLLALQDRQVLDQIGLLSWFDRARSAWRWGAQFAPLSKAARCILQWGPRHPLRLKPSTTLISKRILSSPPSDSVWHGTRIKGDMLIAVPHCQGRVSPVFDTASRLLVVRRQGDREVERKGIVLGVLVPGLLARSVAELRVDVFFLI